ncbi:hypothetical protein ACFLVN_05565 [Chloroflexota bacterium]
MRHEKPLKSSRIDLPDTVEDIYQSVCDQGWGDGLPVVPPTEERVHQMIDYTCEDPDRVVAEVAPLGGEATIEKIAINAVMAGCLPEYMPVLVAVVEAMAPQEFNLTAIQTTTNPVTVLTIVNGPIRHKIKLNCTRGCMGPGYRANATIGRAIRFILLNIGCGIPDTVDKAIHGMPGKYTFCFGEDEEGNPWQPFHVDKGFDKETSTVTVIGAQATHNVLTNSPDTATFLKLVANSMSTMGNNDMVLGGGQPVVVITSAHAAILAGEGFSKKIVKDFLFANAGVPVAEYPILGTTAGKDIYVANGKVMPCRTADDIMLVVAGADNPLHIVTIPTFGETRAVTKAIDRAD